jgi:DNA repair exonuclease SbcCD ATPase subunit
MITFEKVRWKNFLSTGNTFTEVDLTANKTNLIIGTNGAGKSTILDALTFSLFGKPFRKINKPMLVNSVNEKDCMVEIEFKIGPNDFVVKRGIKPAKFEIWQNGAMLDQSSNAADYQKQLEQNILKMNYKSFTQIVVLGSSTFVPFMRLPLAQRREIIEDILDIQIFSMMNVALKDKLKTSTEEMREVDYSADMADQKICMQRELIEQLSTRDESMIKEKQERIDTLLGEEEICQESVSKLNEESQKLYEDLLGLESANKKLITLNNLKGKLTNKCGTFKKQHQFFEENDTCPTCSQSISKEVKEHKAGVIRSQVKELVLAIEELRCNILDEQERSDQHLVKTQEMSEIQQKIAGHNATVTRINKNVRQLMVDVETLQNSKDDNSEEEEKLKYLLEERDNLKKQVALVKRDRDTLLAASHLLKDNGIKTRIIKRYLPVMNKLINQYLQNMDFYINFALNENFEETIKSRFRDIFSYESFSEGEKARIDIALLLTWRSIAKLKNSVDTNILILDEIFDGSLDQNGTGELGWILRNFDDNTNVFVISHKESLEGKFDRTLVCEKIKNFSVVKETVAEAV